MQITNLATVSVDTSGTNLISLAQAQAATQAGMDCMIINPSVDIVLVDAGGASPSSPVPSAVAGTVANSPLVCPAGVPTILLHRSGVVRAISTSGTATVKVALGVAP